MKRKLYVGMVVVAALAAVSIWRCDVSSTGDHVNAATSASSTITVSAERARVDPRKLQRASIAGTVRDQAHSVIPSARVCAQIDTRDLPSELVREPRCTIADARGHYRLGELYAARYRVAAGAKPYRSDVHHPGGDRKQSLFQLAAGEHKIGVDIVLRAGGVELTGTVSDITGGPIAHAHVSSWTSPSVETDDAGKFSMWVSPGDIDLEVSAEGYASQTASASAPGSIEIELTPESSLSGTVVDANTGTPVPGVTVTVAEIGGAWLDDLRDITDDEGKFHVRGLEPGRYEANVSSPGGYGRSDGSVLVGLGQHVDGAIVKLHRAYQVSGKVVVAGTPQRPCREAELVLFEEHSRRPTSATGDLDGTVRIDGTLPGRYRVDVECDGFQPRGNYAIIEVKDRDVSDLVWEVDAGATVRGKVLTKAGAPVADAEVRGISERSSIVIDTTTHDGHYELTGLRPGELELDVSADRLQAPEGKWTIDVAAGAMVDKDLVLEAPEPGGAIKGIVVDPRGVPVADAQVEARRVGTSNSWGDSTSSDGMFSLDDMRPGAYLVTASLAEAGDRAGTTASDGRHARVDVAIGKVATVRLVLAARRGRITGTVIDNAGKPISDAFVAAQRETGDPSPKMEWNGFEEQVMSGIDGRFALSELAPGTYTLRAYHRGGGEAMVEHVPVGGTAQLQIRATGSIAGTVRRPIGGIEELAITLLDTKTGVSRDETFFRTDGRFTLRDLPASRFTLTIEAAGGKKQLTVDLAEGQRKTVDITLDDLVAITGRIVDLVTEQPVAGMTALVTIGKTGLTASHVDDQATSDSDGRFKIAQAPRGWVTIFAIPRRNKDYAHVLTVREITGNGPVDIGTLKAVRSRLPKGESGELGVEWAEQGDDISTHSFKVASIDPDGPAAKTDLKVGDVVTKVDGIDVTGANAYIGRTLMDAPPGTPIKLGLARGTTVTIILGEP